MHWEVRVSYFLILAGVSSGHQSWDSVLRKGCSSTSRALSLSFAVFTSSLEMRSFALFEIRAQSFFGNWNFPLWMLWKRLS